LTRLGPFSPALFLPLFFFFFFFLFNLNHFLLMFGVLSWILIQIDRDRNHRERETERGGKVLVKERIRSFLFALNFHIAFCVTH
jgi:hypothetical protein